ncbi:MAG TPA: YitT family protein [Anaerolineaceae bacterium]
MDKNSVGQTEPPRTPGLGQILTLLVSNFDFSWDSLRDYLFLLAGALVQALAMRMFLIPAELVSGGISGTAQLINFYTHWPIGLMVLAGNVPLFFLGWQYLGGPRFALRTALAVVAFSLLTDISTFFLPNGLVHDPFLNSLYGGVLLGIGLGLVYRGKGTSGGSDILGRILNHKLGISISQSYMMTDTVVILAAGFVFGWQNALYALVTTYVSGLAAEMVLEGSGVFREAMIITSYPDKVAEQIMTILERGVTILAGTGAYTGQSRQVLYCVITRAEVSRIKEIVQQTDPKAFMVIGMAHEALGEGFRPLKR